MAFIALICLIGFGLHKAYQHDMRLKALQPPPPPPCKHVWSKWGPPEEVSNWFSGNKAVQHRTCEKCGEGERRYVK